MNNSNRCGWAKGEKDILYHDTEWGVPSHDDGYIFEMPFYRKGKISGKHLIILTTKKLQNMMQQNCLNF